MKKVKIDLQYLKKNLDLNRFLESLDQTQNYLEGNSIIDKLLKCYPSFIDKNGDEIDIEEEALTFRNKKFESLFSDLLKLSRLGKLFTTLNKNFKIIKDDYINVSEDVFLVIIFSKINKTYYLSAERRNGRAEDGTSIVYKNKNKNLVLKEMKSLKETTQELKYLALDGDF